jgi:glycine betaine/choline ABC-type transport system substrate-binding protein
VLKDQSSFYPNLEPIPNVEYPNLEPIPNVEPTNQALQNNVNEDLSQLSNQVPINRGKICCCNITHI